MQRIKFVVILVCLALMGPSPVYAAKAPKKENPQKLLEHLKKLYAGQIVSLPGPGGERHFIILPPLGVGKTEGGHPAIFFFHGSRMIRKVFDEIAGMRRHARSSQFYMIYPLALESGWINSSGAGNFDAAEDIAFVARVMDHVLSEYPIDKNKIFAAGFSSGGSFTYALACGLSGRVAAIASVAGNMPASVAANCRPAHPVSVLLIHGTEDPFMPWTGSSGTLKHKAAYDFLSITDTVAFWKRHDKAREIPITGSVPKRVRGPTRTRRYLYPGGASNSQVMLYEVIGGGHTWPGGWQYANKRMIGHVSRDFDAGLVILDFFGNKSLS